MKAYKLLAFLLFVCTFAVAEGDDDWYPSRWGAGDEIGALNNVTAERVLKAVKLVKTGKVYALGIETNAATPAFAPRVFHITVVQPNQVGGGTLGPTLTTYNDDQVAGWIGIDYVYYNGLKASEFVAADGLKKLGIETYPPMVARGVLLDMAAYYDTDVVPAGTAFNRKEIDEAAKDQGVEIREGDVVLFHTGHIALIGKDNERYMAGEPGLGKEGALYLAEKNITAVGADNFGVEVVPFESEDSGSFEIHQIMLARKGIFLLENMNTGPLAADGVHEFLFVLGQARLSGAVQAIINPVAIH
jgi:kynurenine formamidase